MRVPFETVIERTGSTILISAHGDLDASAVCTLRQALDGVTPDTSVALIDLHEVAFMDSSGLLLLLDLHRRAECMGLRVLVVGWQPQPKRLMAAIAGIPGPGSAAGERFALTGFRHLIEQRAERQRDLAAKAEQRHPALPL
ncbi:MULTISPECIES: STAS domain-containing protein [unclassified Streptomyces]|uniref:STAS domain-containing protein n=1 Tax=unclassified Streptomyces TaxID=2593676 RepID=UPI003805E54F